MMSLVSVRQSAETHEERDLRSKLACWSAPAQQIFDVSDAAVDILVVDRMREKPVWRASAQNSAMVAAFHGGHVRTITSRTTVSPSR